MVNIKGLTDQSLDKTEQYKKSYKEWRNFRKDTKENYFIIPKELERYLSLISTRALNLYLYYCFKSRNETGESWYAIKSIAEDLGASSRSINTWNSTLEEAGLIVRDHGHSKSKTTFLLPLSNYYLLENDLSIKEVIKKSIPEIAGDLVAVYHLFQYTKSDNKKNYDKPYNIACCVFKREHGIGNEKIQIYKFILVKEQELDTFRLNSQSSDFESDAYLFKNDILNKLINKNMSENENLIIENFAVKSHIILEDPKNNEVLELLNELTNGLDKVGDMIVIE